MFKNVAILILIATNTYSLYYIYTHFNPIEEVTVNSEVKTEKPLFFYRVTLRDGGKVEASGYIEKETSVDLVEDKKVTFTISKRDIHKVEKVYYQAGKKNHVVTRVKTIKNINN